MTKVINGDARKMNLSEFDAPYGVIVADPPWSYTNSSVHGNAKDQYNTMTIDDICNMPVSQLAAKDGVLFLWGTWPLLPEALRVMTAWGYTYKTGFPWVKINQNMALSPGVGFWVRGVSEFIFIGVRGNAKCPIPEKRYMGIIAPNLKHSRKPDSVHQIAETLKPPYLELFAREGRIGWTCFGNEVTQANNRLQPTAFGAGGLASNSLQGSFIADESSAKIGGG